MLWRFTVCCKEDTRDPGDLTLDADDVVSICEGHSSDEVCTAKILLRTGVFWVVYDENRDTAERIATAQGQFGILERPR
jgi:hypothetical protein